MNFLRRVYQNLSRNLKFSVSDPKNFEEIWSINSTRIRVLSLLLIVMVLFSFMLLYFSGAFVGGQDMTIERESLEDQNEQIAVLSEKVAAQEAYISNIRRILNGEISVDTPLDSLSSEEVVNLDSLDHNATDAENKLAEKMKEDMLTNVSSDDILAYFSSPVLGVVSQKFDENLHPGVDVVTPKDMEVKACLSGTVVYSGYTRKDGYILVVDHGNGYLSIYKHNRRVFKKMGDKVKLGDPIAIVGNTGENTDGPHLHFELWYDQRPVNPEDYINFTK